MFILAFIPIVFSYSIKDKYCGDDNCFYILKLGQTATLQEIRKSFRSLSQEFHPDKIGEEGTKNYRKIVQAYEVLSDPNVRASYEDFLNNPDRSELYYHYNYYQKVYHPQTNPYIVVISAITLLSLIQYAARMGMYRNACLRVQETSHFKKVVNDRIAESRQPREQVVKELLKEVNITGAWSRPEFKDIWIVALIIWIFNYIYWPYFLLKWRLLYHNSDREVPRQDAIYKTSLLLGYDVNQAEYSENLITRKLWIQSNWDLFEQECRKKYEEYKLQNQNKFKQAKRWMKKYS